MLNRLSIDEITLLHKMDSPILMVVNEPSTKALTGEDIHRKDIACKKVVDYLISEIIIPLRHDEKRRLEINTAKIFFVNVDFNPQAYNLMFYLGGLVQLYRQPEFEVHLKQIIGVTLQGLEYSIPKDRNICLFDLRFWRMGFGDFRQ